jgi:hypothetical protein
VLLIAALVLPVASPAWAAPAPTLLTSGSSTTDQSSYTTASVTAHANKLILVCVAGRPDDNSSQAVTVSGLSATWAQVALADSGAFGRFAACYRTMVSSDQTGTITLNYNETQLTATWAVTEWSGVDLSGTNGSGAIVQAVTNNATSATSLTVTLAGFSSSVNRPYAFFRYSGSTGTSSEAGWTSLPSDITDAENSSGVLGEWRNDTSDTTPSASSSASGAWAGIAIEIRAEGVSGSMLLMGVGP